MSEQAEIFVGDAIKAKLQEALNPVSLEVIDESHKHAGHAHAVMRPGTATGHGGTHFHVKVVSEAFKGKSRVDRHRTINGLLQQELNAGVHALAIDAKAPGE
ncbi:BolA family protein [Beijerinckia indica]|uniref:BolA family protein n=1 Tax=Beijerinckia indica subsp. indica (strain ATCC 9039 / DSM 1715 / NCIMB 8712) TaxID=395963 RepID=B2IEP6_BEII9|nr:BolA family protein [Beijerinckia indica]ACB96986.1 BolA family protein [Beijerinckia indica subsp. indica ATCC 9039]